MKPSHEGFPTEREKMHRLYILKYTQIDSHTIPAKSLRTRTPDPKSGEPLASPHRQVDLLVRHTCKKMCSPHAQNRGSLR